MIAIRKADLYLQLLIGGLMMLSIPILFLYSFLFGLVILGSWQVISASLNTSAFLKWGLQREIKMYWMWTAAVLLTPFLCWIGNGFMSNGISGIGIIILTVEAFVVIYYWTIYQKLIGRIELRHELSCFTKSKH